MGAATTTTTTTTNNKKKKASHSLDALARGHRRAGRGHTPNPAAVAELTARYSAHCPQPSYTLWQRSEVAKGSETLQRHNPSTATLRKDAYATELLKVLPEDFPKGEKGKKRLKTYMTSRKKLFVSI